MTTNLTSASTERYDDVTAPVNGEPRDAGNLVSESLQPVTNRTRWLRKRTEDRLDQFLPVGGLLPVAASVATSTFTIAGHGLSANDPVRVMSVGGSVPSPLAVDTTYFVVGGSLTTNTFQVSATFGGSAITLTDNGSGTIYVAKRVTSKFYQLNADGLSTFSSTLHQTGGSGIIGDSGLTLTGGITQSTGSNTLGGDTIVAGVLQPAKAVAPLSSVINPTSATVTVDASKNVWTLDTPNAGATTTINVDSTTVVPVADQEISIIVWRIDTHTPVVSVVRPSGPVTICSFGTTDKLAIARLKWSTATNTWRLVGFFGSGTINNP